MAQVLVPFFRGFVLSEDPICLFLDRYDQEVIERGEYSCRLETYPIGSHSLIACGNGLSMASPPPSVFGLSSITSLSLHLSSQPPIHPYSKAFKTSFVVITSANSPLRLATFTACTVSASKESLAKVAVASVIKMMRP